VRDIEWILNVLSVPVFSVPGNHDEVGSFIGTDVDKTKTSFRGISIFGIGGSGPEKFGFPYEWSEEDIGKLEIPEVDIIVSHTPPKNSLLDQLPNGMHVGSRSIRDIAQKGNGVLISGHIHESVNVQRINNRLCYNAGSLGPPYGRTQYGIIERNTDLDLWIIKHYVLIEGEWVMQFSSIDLYK